MRVIDLNADIGEGADDLAIADMVSSVNVACGLHAGDAETMARSVRESARLGCVVGAHPGYPDAAGGGRRGMAMPAADVRRTLLEQIRALIGIAERYGVRIEHVKPHGALYNQAAKDQSLASVVATAVRDAGVPRLVGLAGSALIVAAEEAGIRAIEEGFADRAYSSDGSLVPRGTPGALIEEPSIAARQAVALAEGHELPTSDGGLLRLTTETICVHADTPGAFEISRAVRSALEMAGFTIMGTPSFDQRSEGPDS